MNTIKYLSFLHINNEKSEREIKVIMPFTFTTERIKYLGIILSKETKDIYAENCKTLMKGIKDNTNKMERYIMFLHWKNQYCENDYTTQRNL